MGGREASVKAETDEMENMYLNFIVGGDVYGIDIRYVIQIVGMQEVRAMPDTPHGMKGYINLRGRVIPVVSMRLRFGKMEEEYSDRNCIVVVMVGEREMGVIVDAIQETIIIGPEKISPQPTVGKSEEVPYVKGVAQLPNDRTAVLIHVQKLFDEEDLSEVPNMH